MIKRFAVKLFPVAFLLVASPIFAQTPCYQVNGPGPVTLRFECLTSSPGSSSNFTWYGPSQDSMCSYSAPNGLYKSDGAYGSGYGNFYFLTPSSSFAYYQFMIILDLNNTHNSSGNRVSIMVYDDDNYTFLETLGTIDGSGGNICSGQYYFNVYRPGWANRHLHLAISPWFSDYDANSKVGGYSLNAYDHQVW